MKTEFKSYPVRLRWSHQDQCYRLHWPQVKDGMPFEDLVWWLERRVDAVRDEVHAAHCARIATNRDVSAAWFQTDLGDPVI